MARHRELARRGVDGPPPRRAEVDHALATVPMPAKRANGEWPPKDAGQRPDGKGCFSLGKLGLPINIVGCCGARASPSTLLVSGVRRKPFSVVG